MGTEIMELKLNIVGPSYYSVEVCRNPIEGIFVSPSAKNKFAWFGVIFVRKGIFGGGIFRFNIEIPLEFPESSELPKVIFNQTIFHPLICIKSKELCLKRSFPDGWKSEKHSLSRVLIVLQHRDKFREIAKECVEASRAMVYDDVAEQEDDSNGIRLLPWDALIHKTAREKMILVGEGSRSQGTAAGFRRDHVFSKMGLQVNEIVGRSYPMAYSWFDPEEMTVITKYDDISPVTSARLDREKHGIEPLDLSIISVEESGKKL
ncbi:Protein CBR-UBC-19 [Caenorhabditis briggsae]|uniref:Protein CBR-UBC-19 n=1 Tax=Caenorhabditis briggsae TaxID=6238 RepID=A8XYG4_CAEBR|nr:Protein CBR-UBC-19 [Caenorhabditis briggsae]CAP37681.2 Protein CBR-UBC-19 [Caenorhabditis briggsae]